MERRSVAAKGNAVSGLADPESKNASSNTEACPMADINDPSIIT
jgi:hypothetical protein